MSHIPSVSSHHHASAEGPHLLSTNNKRVVWFFKQGYSISALEIRIPAGICSWRVYAFYHSRTSNRPANPCQRRAVSTPNCTPPINDPSYRYRSRPNSTRPSIPKARYSPCALTHSRDSEARCSVLNSSSRPKTGSLRKLIYRVSASYPLSVITTRPCSVN
jgi:hypothetical protein